MSKIKNLLAAVEEIDDLAPTEDDIQLAHMAYITKKETILNELHMLKQTLNSQAQIEIVEDAVKFINDGEF